MEVETLFKEIFHWQSVSNFVGWIFKKKFEMESNGTQTKGFIAMLTFKDNDFGRKLETNRQLTIG